MTISSAYGYRAGIWGFLIILVSCYGTSVLAEPRAPMVVVDLAEQTTLIEEVPLTGTVISPRIANLSTEVSGLIENMEIEPGDHVRAGDEILRLNSELEALSLSAARAATEQAVQELADAKRRLADARRLAERQSVSANEIESLAAEVRIDSAVVSRYRAEQQRQTAALRRHKLKAPFAGVISRKLVEQGEWIQPGQAVVELIATTGLRIDFQVPQSVYAKLDQVADVRIRLDALPGKTFDGAIESVIPVTDPTTRTFMIRVALSDPEVKLAAGMSASAVLRLNTGVQGVVIHRDALIRYPDGRITLWIVKREGDVASVSEQQVKTGLSFNGKLNIIEGLTANTTVVVQGNEALREGQRVVVKRDE
ncbi:MAG: efflux RND transporter periplasmic adaptor subunit [Candidatus Thiodiazotropha sp. (ex Monitilora ramsayi)]|nr:efflux RND transporter periplasmic adaptor subunit [Candidatus Thiodiazotropha sp. (ex Monitilora ramsayi)]